MKNKKKKFEIISNDVIKAFKFISKKKKLNLHEPYFSKDDISQVKNCIQKTNVSTASPVTLKFEKEIKKYTKSKYTLAIVNGTSALHLAIAALKIKKYEEIFIPSFNYVASTNATLYCGAIPHYIDIELENFGIDVNKLENYISKKCKIKNNKLINKDSKRAIRAIIITHVFGVPGNIDYIKRFCAKYKLKIIEDAAEAFGSFYKKKHLGTFGDFGILSFNGNKIITTGGGGAILTQKKSLYLKVLKLATIAKKKNFLWKYDYDEMGYNYRLPGINSSLGISQIKKIKKLLKNKKKVHLLMKNFFKSNTNFKLINPKNIQYSNIWLNNIFLFNSTYDLRDNVVKFLNKKGIHVRPAWTLMHKINYLSKFPKMDLSNSLLVEKSLVSLPSSPNLIKDE